MISGTRARYAFAACLLVSVVDLSIVDFVIGPWALGPEPAPSPRQAPAPVAAPATTSPATAAAATAASAAATAALAGRSAPRVVARFESDQPTASDEDLRALATAMIADPSGEILLEGHTDQRGDPDHNRALSLERARWAQNRLVELGVSASRIAVVGLGAERPLAKGDDDAAVASNRRVEVRWLASSPSPSPSPAGDR
ncbi:MAG TPA: OmpA family protein [Labilithrix sp.]|nr:OmpA family protein [Labilithrix sp.]